jgi:hypothetical protein
MAKFLVATLVATIAVGTLPVEKFKTPLGALPITDEQVPLAQAFIDKVDAGDAVPDDGKIEETFGKSWPVRFNWLFIHLKEDVKLDTTLTVELLDALPAGTPVSSA